MANDSKPTSEPQVTCSSGRTDQSGSQPDSSPPDLRILHYNDVYHVDESSAEPVGGLSRFMTMVKEYQEAESDAKIVTLFSGDAFNPSLESSVTKGESSTDLQVCVDGYGLERGKRVRWMQLTD